MRETAAIDRANGGATAILRAHDSPRIGSTSLAPFAGSRVVVTGGMGFMGSRLALALTGAGARVTVADNGAPDSGAAGFNLAPARRRIAVERVDLRDPSRLPRLIADADYVFNLAALTSHVRSMSEPLEDLDVNCRGTLALLEACRRHNPGATIVHAGTRQVYGRVPALPVSELQPERPVDANGVSKLAADLYAQLYHRAHGMRVRVLRFTNTYGPRMRVRDAHQMFLGAWIRAVVEGRPFEVWGGSQRRDLTFVDDAVAACCAAALSPAADGEILNVGGASLSLAALAELLVEVNGGGRFVVTEYPADRATIEIGDYAADDRRLRALTGWKPRVPLRAGLARTIRYYRQHLHAYL